MSTVPNHFALYRTVPNMFFTDCLFFYFELLSLNYEHIDKTKSYRAKN